jgi:hypothetical protein
MMVKGTLILFFFLPYFFATAQKQTRYGVMAGWSVSDLLRSHNINDVGNEWFPVSKLQSFYVGVSWERKILKTFSMRAEAMLSGDGASSHFAGKPQLNTISIPLFFCYKPESGFYTFIGPRASYTFYHPDRHFHRSPFFWQFVNPFEASIVLGIGYTHRSGLGGMVRYEYGWTPAFADIYNNVLRVGLHYEFHSQKK